MPTTEKWSAALVVKGMIHTIKNQIENLLLSLVWFMSKELSAMKSILSLSWFSSNHARTRELYNTQHFPGNRLYDPGVKQLPCKIGHGLLGQMCSF